MTIEPDTKDWTWVLRERCEECGLTASDVDPASVADLLRDSVPRWLAVLARPDVAVRPDASIWSPLEYACHVRDVCNVFAERVHMMSSGDDPAFANWDQDTTAEEAGYGAQDSLTVTTQLAQAAEALAASFDHVTDDQWQRTGRRSNGSVFTIATLAQYFWHDIAHHLYDVDA